MPIHHEFLSYQGMPPSGFQPDEDTLLKDYFLRLYSPSRDSRGDVAAQASWVNAIFGADREIQAFEQGLPQVVLDTINYVLDDEDEITSQNDHAERLGLNPRAAAFVPGLCKASGDTQGAIDDAINDLERYKQSFPPLFRWNHEHGPPKSTLPSARDWQTILWVAAHTHPEDMQLISDYGGILVRGREWSGQALMVLACHIFWRGSEPSSIARSPPLSSALLAFGVYRDLKASGNTLGASLFASALRDCAVGFIRSFWDASSKATAIRLRPCDPYPAPLLACAHYLAAFVGFLYRCDLIGREPILSCLSVLLTDLTTMEHLDAIQVLLESSGVFNAKHSGFSDTDRLVDRFAHRLTRRTRQLRPDMSAAGKPRNSACVQRTTQAVLAVLSIQSGRDFFELLNRSDY